MTLWCEIGVGHEAEFRWGVVGAEAVMILMLINYVHDCVNTTEGKTARGGGGERSPLVKC